MNEIVITEAETEYEIEQALSIRKEVFVHEQGVFPFSDIDENDKKCTYLIARLNGKIIGTVRLFPADEAGSQWMGGRLAVLKPFRSLGVGKLLIQSAVRNVSECGATTFSAYVQTENVDLFLRLGWKPVGHVQQYFGRAHQLMEAPIAIKHRRTNA